MTQKLTEEQQRVAHKIIKANRGDCAKGSNYLYCIDCAHYNGVKSCLNYRSPEFQAKNLRRSQAWLDAHITDAEIMAESPREFCERMVRTKGFGICKGRSFFSNTGSCKNCVIFTNKSCSENLTFSRAKAYLASHPATPQEPPKRRPKPDEMVVGAPVRVRLWDELVRDGKLDWEGDIFFQKSSTFFFKEKQESCGTTHKIIKSGDFVILEGCKDWKYTSEMLDYVEPEKVVEPKSANVNFFDWYGKKVVFKDGRNKGAQYTVCGTYRDLDFDGAIHFKTVFFFKLLEIKGASFPAQLFNLCETQDTVKPEPVANAPAPEAKEKGDTTVKGDVDKLPIGLRFINFRDLLPVDALRIITLEGQVDDLTKKLTASKKLCERQQRRLRANWEAKHTTEEIEAWFDAGNGAAMINGSASQIRLNSCKSEPVIKKEISLSEIYGEVVDEINLNIKDYHRIFTRVKPATCSFDGIKFTETPEEKTTFSFKSDVTGFRSERDIIWPFSEPLIYSINFSKDEMVRYLAWETWCNENGFDGIIFNTKENESDTQLVNDCIDAVRKRHEEKK